MRQAGYAALFFMAGILFPVLIWVALVVAIREPLLRTLTRVSYAVLFFLVGIFMPVLIWVGLGVSVNQWVRQSILRQEPARTVGEILAAAGLMIQWEGTGGEAMAAPVFVRQPMSEIRELLARAGL